MKSVRSFLTLATAALLTAGAVYGSSASAETIPAGIYPNYPPLDMRNIETNKLTGFDVELGEAIAQKMGAQIKWEESSYAELISAVKTDRIRVFFNGMDDTPERQKQIDFVDYIRSGNQFIVPSAKAVHDPLELCGKKIAISRSTSTPVSLANWNKNSCEKAGRPDAIYLPAENSIDARMQMQQGRADAVMMDSLTIPYIIAQSGNAFATVGEPLDFTLMGIGVTKGDQALQQRIQKALQALVDDGTYGKLLSKWKLSPSSAVQTATINAGHAF
jgi:polar amino acid transport system substrate-binding protein